MKTGKYQHHKGELYEVICVATHRKTKEELVVYKALYGDKKIWARTKKMFLEDIVINNKRVPRFKKIKD